MFWGVIMIVNHHRIMLRGVDFWGRNIAYLRIVQRPRDSLSLCLLSGSAKIDFGGHVSIYRHRSE